MDKPMELKDINKILSRRKKAFFSVFGIILFIGLIIAIALPPIYQSMATLRVEDQLVSEDLVQTTLTTYVEKKIARISQNVLNRQRLMMLAEKHYLKNEKGKTKTDEQVLRELQQSIKIEPVFTKMPAFADRNNNPTINIAFHLSYEGKEPETVRDVTRTLSNLFIQEDNKMREQVVSATNRFLKAELGRLRRKINTQEEKISKFKQDNQGMLPQDSGYNFQMILKLDRQLNELEGQRRFLEEKQMLLESQIKTIDPLSPIVVQGGKVAANPNARLKQLYLTLTQLSAKFSSKHPDIKRVKREIAELESQIEGTDTSVMKVKRVYQLETELAELKASYNPNHPKVKSTEKEIELLKKEIDTTKSETVRNTIARTQPDNPAYIRLDTELKAIDMKLKAIQFDKQQVKSEIDKYQRAMDQTPVVEKQLEELQRDLNSLQENYNDISKKLAEARVTTTLEAKQQAQRVSIVSPAYLPSEPSKPNRPLILGFSFIAAFVIGSFFIAFREGMDNSIKDADQINAIVGIPVISSISYIETGEEKFNRFIKTILTLLIITGLIVAALFTVDHYIYKIDNLWPVVIERFQMFV